MTPGDAVAQDPKLKALFTEMCEHYSTQIGNDKGIELANEVNKVTDEVNEHWASKIPEKISCKKGCAFCCHYFVDISKSEAVNLRKHVLPSMMEQLTYQAANGSTLETFNQMPYGKRRCVFLGDDNTCTVYSDRPLSCRKYFVT